MGPCKNEIRTLDVESPDSSYKQKCHRLLSHVPEFRHHLCIAIKTRNLREESDNVQRQFVYGLITTSLSRGYKLAHKAEWKE